MGGPDIVKSFIERHHVNAVILEFHDTVESVKSASRLSGIPEERILKTMVLKSDKGFIAVILRGDTRLDLSKLRRELGLKRLRLARPDELKSLLGVGPGEVSPFLPGLAEIPVFIDAKAVEVDGEILAGGGSLRHLVKTTVEEILRVHNPRVIDVSRG